MIGSFWNLCRACPSMPVDKLHSEYRSTYRWHEYRGGNKPANGVIPGDTTQTIAGGAQQVSTGVENSLGGPPVVRRAPLPSQNANGPRAPSIEPAMPRRKKYPGVAYKTNEFFDGPPAGLPSGAIREGSYTLDRARSMERSKYLANKGERRSKSEGPRNALSNGPRNWTDTVEEKATSPSIAEKMCVSSEYRNQFAWPRDAPETIAESVGQPKKSASMGALKAAQQAAKRRPGEGGPTELEPLMNHTDEDDDKKRYIEDYMKDSNHQQPATRRSTFRNAIASFRRTTTEQKEQTKPKGYKSEYKKKFRPFSHYVYEASKGTFTKRRAAKKEDVVDGGAGGTRGAGPPVESKAPAPTPQHDEAKTIATLQGVDTDSWYREVLDLRKRAGEYKYRGWGTELAPDHLTELYNKQMDLWYQVSRRSSLSALSLASANHRVLGKDEKESESRRTSPSKKQKSFRMAPHQSMNAKISDPRTETSAQRAQRKKLQGHSFDNTSVTEGKAGRTSARTSPRKQLNLVIGGRGASVEPSSGDHKPLYRSPKRRPRSADPKPLSNGPLEDRRRPSKPSGLALKKYTPSEDNAEKKYKQTPSLSGSPKRKAKSRVGITIDDDVIPLRTGSAFRDHRGTLLDDSPVVKSPPEPTRVKSPEQMNMRSPDPVNWTVPLDTGKTFTVSQTVKSDDLIKRPGSDFRGQWGGDDPHSASLSAPLDHTEGSLKKYGSQHQQQMPSTSQQELPIVHTTPSTSKQDNTKLTPPKTVEISQQPIKLSGKLQAKTPTSPPTSLTPIDETKILEVVTKTPIVNGGNESNSETSSSPTTEHRKSITSPTIEQRKSYTSPTNEQRKSIVSPTSEQRKSIVSPTSEQRKSIVSPSSEQRKSIVSPTIEQKKSPVSPSAELQSVTTEQPKLSGPIRLDDPTFEMGSLLKTSESNTANNNNTFKPTEATQKSHGVNTSVVVANPNQASIAAEVLERARTRFDQFWGKKEENDSV